MRFASSLLVLVVGCGGNVETSAPPDASSDTAVITDTSLEPDAPVSDVPGAFDECTGPAQCTLAIAACCWPCGDAALTDYDAINRARSDAHRAAVCTDPAPACPKCATIPNENHIAFCRAERCVRLDLRTDPISDCTKDDDCMLRAGTGCCETCATPPLNGIVALNKSKAGELNAQVCDPAAGACPPCVPAWPTGVSATCDPTTRHCRLTIK